MERGDGARAVLHVDVDAFFVQVECHRNPLLQASMALAVQQHQDVICVSYAARALGVKKHMAPSEIRRNFPSVKLVHVHTVGEHNDKVSYKFYRRASKAIHTILKGFCQRCEKASMDEAYLEPSDLELPTGLASDSEALVRAEQLAQAIKETLARNLRYECSVGVAKNKLLAKIASQRAKPTGICVIAEADVQNVLKDTEVFKVPGWGERSRIGGILTERGCKFVADVQRFDMEHLIELVGDKYAQQLYSWSRGIDDAPVDESSAPKSIVAQLALSPVPLPVYEKPGHFLTPVYAYDLDAVLRFIDILSEDIVDRMLEDEEEHNRRAGTVTLVYSTDERHRTQKSCSSACPSFPPGTATPARVEAIRDAMLQTFRRIKSIYETSVEGKHLDEHLSTLDGFPIDVFMKPLTRLNITLTNFQGMGSTTQLTVKNFFAPTKVSPAKRKQADLQPDSMDTSNHSHGYDILAEKDSSTSSCATDKPEEVPLTAMTITDENVDGGHEQARTKRQKPSSSGKRRSEAMDHFQFAGEVTDDMAATKVACDVCKCLVDLAAWDEHRDYHVALQIAELPPTQPIQSLRPRHDSASAQEPPSNASTSTSDGNNSGTRADHATVATTARAMPAASSAKQPQPDNIDIWLSRTLDKPSASGRFRFSEVLGAFSNPANIARFFHEYLSEK